jgi:hypothetical protein
MCKLICILTTTSNADVLCASSDRAMLVCSGVWGLFSFIALIVYLRWHGDHSSARDVPTDKLPGLLSQKIQERRTMDGRRARRRIWPISVFHSKRTVG